MKYFYRATIAFTLMFSLLFLVGAVQAGQKESTKTMVERVMRQKVEALRSKNMDANKISVKAQRIADPLGSPFELYQVVYENDGNPMGSMTVSVIDSDGSRYLLTGGAVWDLEQEVEMQYLWSSLTKKAEIPYTDAHLVAGTPDKCSIPVTVFSDYLCYYCKRFMPEVQKIVEKSDDMCLYLYDMPLLQLHKKAKYISQLALAYQSLSGEIVPVSIYESTFKDDEDPINEYFEDLIAQKGIKPKDFYKKASSPEILDKIEKDMELAETLNLSGTPSVFVDGHKVDPKTDQVIKIISYVRKMNKDSNKYASIK